MATEYRVLKMTAEGFVENPEIYGAMYKQIINDNLDEEGKVIDPKEQARIMFALREVFEEMGRIDLAVLIEKVVEYENFGGSEDLMKFIKLTKAMAMKIEKHPEYVLKIYDQYAEKVLAMPHLERVEHMTKVYLFNYATEYAGSVYKKVVDKHERKKKQEQRQSRRT